MKLYTEKQVNKAYKDGNLDGFNNVSALDMCINSLTPIELPSDEEIKKAANSQSHYEGAMWLKYKILNQNK